MSRRECLGGLARLFGTLALPIDRSAAHAGGAAEPARHALRTAVLARWIAETLFAIGVTPTALPELRSGDKIWRSLDLSDGIVDLGLTGEPNLDLLAQLRLDLILVDRRLQAGIAPRLESIAPVVVAEIYSEARAPLAAARSEMLRLGEILARRQEATHYIASTERGFERALAAVREHRDRPIFVVRLLDERNIVLHCGGSIFHDVLVRLGIEPASRAANSWGFLTTGIETLASVPEARIVYFEPVPKEAARLFARPSLWSHLPSVQKGLTTPIPELYSWGGLPTAKRFAETLAEQLPREAVG